MAWRSSCRVVVAFHNAATLVDNASIHLNTQEEFEQVDYPKDPEFFKKYGTRGVLHSWATDKDDPTVDQRFGKVGKQRIEDTGQLGKERMKTMDETFMDASLDFMKRSKEGDKPFFVWLNTCRMHMYNRSVQCRKSRRRCGRLFAEG